MTRKPTPIGHEFVEYIPQDLLPFTLYLSITYATAVHLCACGCGQQVVTPISPADWTLTYDGDSVSLTPSIGNWAFPCRSHYWIKHNTVRWAAPWTDKQIAAGRARDARGRDNYIARRANIRTDTAADPAGTAEAQLPQPRPSPARPPT